MKLQQKIISPLDIVILLKIIAYEGKQWNQLLLAEELFISQAEVSRSLARSKFAGLLDPAGKHVFQKALMEFLQYGIKYVFPQQPGAVVRGIPTAHSAMPLNEVIQSEENYVWPSGKGCPCSFAHPNLKLTNSTCFHNRILYFHHTNNNYL